jgi:1,4-alpha-glucan branching enzyme
VFFELDSDPVGFAWIDGADNERSVVSFARFDRAGNALAVVANFSGRPHHDYVLGLPHAGEWTEIFNSDSVDYSGSGEGNMGRVTAVAEAWNHSPAQARLMLPPLSVVFLFRTL